MEKMDFAVLYLKTKSNSGKQPSSDWVTSARVAETVKQLFRFSGLSSLMFLMYTAFYYDRDVEPFVRHFGRPDFRR